MEKMETHSFDTSALAISVSQTFGGMNTANGLG